MTLSHLVDSDWTVWWLRGRPEAVTALRDLYSAGLAISAVTLAELWEGIEGSKDPAVGRQGLLDFLRLVRVLPLSNEVAMVFGREAVRLGQPGQRIPDFDLVIAATALHHNLTLLSNDRAHFSRIPGLKLESLAAHG